MLLLAVPSPAAFVGFVPFVQGGPYISLSDLEANYYFVLERGTFGAILFHGGYQAYPLEYRIPLLKFIDIRAVRVWGGVGYLSFPEYSVYGTEIGTVSHIFPAAGFSSIITSIGKHFSFSVSLGFDFISGSRRFSYPALSAELVVLDLFRFPWGNFYTGIKKMGFSMGSFYLGDFYFGLRTKTLLSVSMNFEKSLIYDWWEALSSLSYEFSVWDKDLLVTFSYKFSPWLGYSFPLEFLGLGMKVCLDRWNLSLAFIPSFVSDWRILFEVEGGSQ